MKKRKGTVARVVGGFFCCLYCLLTPCEAYTVKAADLELYASSAVLMDADSGRVLYEKNGNNKMAMASTTKIMTCILTLEDGCLDDYTQVSAYAASMPKVKLYVQRGEEYQVRSLLFSLMLESHNDSAVVLAEYLGKKYMGEEASSKNIADFTPEESKKAVKAFANHMNAKAKEIGCVDTWFITPNGLDATESIEVDGETISREHCTTAAELARMMSYCVNESPCRDVFREITRTECYSFYENGRNHQCVNHNLFLNMMEGAFSGKTGFTNKAGYCYVGALERDGKTFVVTLLACGWPNNKSYKWSDCRKLMEYGLEEYEYREFRKEQAAVRTEDLKPLCAIGGRTKVLGGKAMVELSLAEGEGLSGVLMKADEEVLVSCYIPDFLTAPVACGTQVGEVTYSVDGEIYYTEKILTKTSSEKITLEWCAEEILNRFLLFTVQ